MHNNNNNIKTNRRLCERSEAIQKFGVHTPGLLRWRSQRRGWGNQDDLQGFCTVVNRVLVPYYQTQSQ